MQTSKYTRTEIFIFFLTWWFITSTVVLEHSGIGTYVLLGCSLLILVCSNLKLEIYIFHVMVLQFCLFCYATVFWAMNGRTSLEVSNVIFRYLLLIFILYSYYQKKKDITILFKIVMWAGYFITFYSYVVHGNSILVAAEGQETRRLIHSFANVNNIGMIVATSIIIHAYFYLFEKKTMTILFAIPALYVVAATQSRKALIMVVVGVGLLYVTKYLRNSKQPGDLRPYFKIIGFVSFFTLAILLLARYGPFEGLTARMEGLWASVTGEGEEDASSALRKMYRKIGWIQFGRTPLAGIGINNARILTGRALDKDAYLHNNYAELAADGGSLGLLSYYIMFLYPLFKEFKYIKRDSSALLVVIWIIIDFVNDWGIVSYFSVLTYFKLMIYYLHLNTMRRKYPSLPKKRGYPT